MYATSIDLHTQQRMSPALGDVVDENRQALTRRWHIAREVEERYSPTELRTRFPGQADILATLALMHEEEVERVAQLTMPLFRLSARLMNRHDLVTPRAVVLQSELEAGNFQESVQALHMRQLAAARSSTDAAVVYGLKPGEITALLGYRVADLPPVARQPNFCLVPTFQSKWLMWAGTQPQLDVSQKIAHLVACARI